MSSCSENRTIATNVGIGIAVAVAIAVGLAAVRIQKPTATAITTPIPIPTPIVFMRHRVRREAREALLRKQRMVGGIMIVVGFCSICAIDHDRLAESGMPRYGFAGGKIEIF